MKQVTGRRKKKNRERTERRMDGWIGEGEERQRFDLERRKQVSGGAGQGLD